MRYPHDVPTLRDGSGPGGVAIRAHRAEDAVGSLEQCHDPLSRQWTTVPLDYTLDDAKRFVTQAMPGGWATDTEWGFAVEAPDATGTPRYAGTISLRNHGERRAEVAYGSHPWVRGTGVMERALRLLLVWGFEQRDLDTVIWWANRGNWASRKLAWRLGFAVEGAPRRWLPQRGELLDAWVGTLLAGDPMQPHTPWYDVPRLVGEGTVLRAHTDADVGRIVEACRDPLVSGWIGIIPAPFHESDARAWLAGNVERQAAGRAVTWAVADPRTDALLGSVDLFEIRPGRDAELGYWLHPDGRGRGVGPADVPARPAARVHRRGRRRTGSAPRAGRRGRRQRRLPQGAGTRRLPAAGTGEAARADPGRARRRGRLRRARRGLQSWEFRTAGALGSSQRPVSRISGPGGPR